MRSLPKILVFTILVLINSNSLFAKGDEVGTGVGLAENNIAYAYENLDNFIQLCLKTSVCRINARQRSTLIAIKRSLPLERAVTNQIVFAKEGEFSDFSGTFHIEGKMRIGITGQTIGSKIIFNLDMIYSQRGGKTVAITIDQAVGLLIHELGHHQGIKSHVRLDMLAAKVRYIAKRKVHRSPFDPGMNNTAFYTVISYEIAETSSSLILDFENQSYDVTEKLRDLAKCSDIHDSVTPVFFSFYNLSWQGLSYGRKTRTLGGLIVPYCKRKGVLEMGVTTQFIAKLDVILSKENSNSYTYVDDSFRVVSK